MGGTSCSSTGVPSMPPSNKTRSFQRNQCLEYGIIHKYLFLSFKVKSDESYPNRLASFVLNRAYMKIGTPNSCCTDKVYFCEHFLDFFFCDL